MRYGSVCSGIEAATMAWHPLGWSPAFFAEIEAFPSSVLAHHYGSNLPGEPLSTNGVPNLGDMTKFEEWTDYAIDLLVGGTPCQDYSVAGLRAGMDGIRGSLTLTYAAIARRFRPRWLAWENVPGVLSINGGRDFAGFLGLLSGQRIEVPRDGWKNAGVVPGYHRAYGLAWRVLDAQFIRVDGFGRAVPQRRRRVFVVGYIGDWRRAAAVFFERESMLGDIAPRREAGKGTARETASCLVSSGRGTERAGDTRGQDNVVAVSPTLRAGGNLTGGHRPPGTDVDTWEALVATGFSASGDGYWREDVGPLRARAQDSHENLALTFGLSGEMNANVEVIGALDAGSKSGGGQPSMVLPSVGWAVRRLMPIECERLQGFPDKFTAVPHRGKPAADGPRYKALGNSMAVNVMRWIGQRIEMVERLDKEAA